MANAVSQQNSDHQLRRLAAQRRLYVTAKRWHALDLTLAVVAPPAWSLIANQLASSKPYAALWGITAGLFSSILITLRINQLRESAARVQEEFDCNAFELEWDEIVVGDHPHSELITQEARRSNSATTAATLRDWYPTVVYRLPITAARLVCQRANAWWDRQLRRRYTGLMITIAVVVCLVVFALGIAGHATLEDFVLTVVAPLTPTVLFATRYVRENHAAGQRVEHVQRALETAWNAVLNHTLTDADAARLSRRVQSALFNHRKNAPLVFGTVYRLLRTRQEYEMQFNAEHLAQEYEDA
ncbi:MAG: S-4TM family putative pore-forming effector [Bryobacteraceae bacterium]|nr:hypothetical protein [bacterium]